jgi:hypothetical protein
LELLQMRDGEPFSFRVFLPGVPRFVETWRQGPRSAEWHRHYLVAPGHSLYLAKGERVELTRMRSEDGLRVEQTMLSAAFPLDWMALSLVAHVLAPSLRSADIDGRTPQGFVDSLAVAELPQASVLKDVSVAWHGTITAWTTRLSVPDWDATGVALVLEGQNAHALRALIAAAGFRGVQHRDLDDWLWQAWRERQPAGPADNAGTSRAA